MIDLIQDTISKYFGIDNAILVVLNGYLLFLVVFYSRKNKAIWKDFQASDRILIGGLMGIGLHFLFIMPLTIYIDSILFIFPKNVRELYKIYEFGGFTTQLVSSVIVFSPLIILRREIYLYSKKGSEELKNSIIYYGKKFLYIYLITLSFKTASYISAKYFYTEYIIFNNFWHFITFIDILVTPFIFFGLFVALSLIVYFYRQKDLSESFKWFKEIFHLNIEKSKFKYILFFILIFSSVTIFSIIDKNYSIITPRYILESNEIKGTLALHRPINVDNYVFVKRKYSNISIIFPFFNHTKFLMMDNPSNMKYTPIFSINLDNDELKISNKENYHGKKYLKIDLPVSSFRWDKFEVEISCDYAVNASIIINETLSNIESLGNRFYTINYTLLIENDYIETLYDYRTFAGFKLDSRLRRNTTVIYYENNELKKEGQYDYMISNNWLYPDVYVPKNSTKKMHFVIEGTS